MYSDTNGDSEDYSYTGTYSLSDDGKIVTLSDDGESVALVYSDNKLIMNVGCEVMIFLKKK